MEDRYPDGIGPRRCEMCGEKLRIRGGTYGGTYVDEVGEFWNPDTETSLIGHAECGINAGYGLA
jgi:hypothetical protein